MTETDDCVYLKARMEESGKKRRRRAYLDDFKKIGEKEYEYQGALYYFEDKGTSLKQALLHLWILGILAAACVVAGGCVPAAGVGDSFYVVLPYAIQFVCLFSVIWGLGRLTLAKEPLREYIYEETAAKLPGRSMAALVFGCVSLAGEIFYLFRHDAGEKLPGSVGFLILEALALISLYLFWKQRSKLSWQKKEQK